MSFTPEELAFLEGAPSSDTSDSKKVSEPMAVAPRNKDISTLTGDEIDAIRSVPYVQAPKGMAWWERGLRATAANIVDLGGTVGNKLFITGVKRIKEQEKMFRPEGEKFSPYGEIREALPDTPELAVARMMRDTGIAIKGRTDEWKNAILGDTPEAKSYGEMLTDMVASTPASIAATAGLGWLAGRTTATIATKLGAPLPYAVGAGAVAQVLGSFIASREMSYRGMFEQYKDAGFSFDEADEKAGAWSIPIATLDFIGNTAIIGRVIDPIKKLAEREFTSEFAKNIVGKMAEGVLVEGTTEALQGVLEDQAYITDGIKNFDFKNYMVSRSLEFLSGAISAGGTEGIGVGIQLRARNRMIAKVQEITKSDKLTAASFVDDYILKLNEVAFPEIQDFTGTRDSVKDISLAFDKLSGEQTKQVNPVEAIPNAAEEVRLTLEKEQLPKDDPQAVENRIKELQKEQTALEEEASKKLFDTEGDTAGVEEITQKILELQDRIDGLTVGSEQLKGRVEVSASYIRQQNQKAIKEFIRGQKVGRALTIDDLKNIKKAFRSLIAGVKLPPKALSKMLRTVLSIQTPVQFNAKIPILTETLNKILEAEQTEKWAKLGREIISRMGTSAVTPDAQKFGQHLRNVLKGDHPGNMYSLTSNDITERLKAEDERAVLELKEMNTLDDVRYAVRVLKSNLEEAVDRQERTIASQAKYYGELTAKAVTEIKQKAKGPGKTIEARNLDKHRQDKIARATNRVSIGAAYSESFKAILELLGPRLSEELDHTTADRAHIVGMMRAKGLIDDKIQEIYGKSFQEIWAKYQTGTFAEVPIIGQDSPGEMTRAGAMSLWMMLKNPKVRDQFIKNNKIDPAWVEQFERQEVGQFTEQDFKFISAMDEMFSKYYDLVSKVYETLTGEPLGYERFYFPITRYLTDDEDVGTNQLLQNLMQGKWSSEEMAESENRFKVRHTSKYQYIVPDIYQVVSKYADDMEHFIAYAGYVAKLRAVFLNAEVRTAITDHVGQDWLKLIGGGREDNGFINLYEGKSPAGLDGTYGGKLLGLFARNLLATPKQLFTQMSGIAAGTQLPGVGLIEIGKTASRLHADWESGELKAFLQTAYMRKRMAGAFDQMAYFLREQTSAKILEEVGQGALGKAQSILFSRRLHNFLTLAAKSGDTVSSVVVGWTVYQREMTAKENQHLDDKAKQAKAMVAAQDAIDLTQQPIYMGARPLAFRSKQWGDRLMTIFNSTTANYFDIYRRTMRKAFPKEYGWKQSIQNLRDGKSEVDTNHLIRTILTYHLWVPLFEFLLANGIPDEWDDLKTFGFYSALGPYGYHVLIGQTISAIGAAAYQGFIPEADMPKFMTEAANGNLLGAATQRSIKAMRKAYELLEYPDYESMWEFTKAAGGMADIVVPVSYPLRVAEGAFNMTSGNVEDTARGIGLTVGLSEYQVNRMLE